MFNEIAFTKLLFEQLGIQDERYLFLNAIYCYLFLNTNENKINCPIITLVVK